MNFKLIFRLLGIIMSLFTLSFVLCGAIAYYARDFLGEKDDPFSWIICIIITGLLSLFCLAFGRKSGNKLFRKEALCLIGLSWILCSVVGALPYVFIIDSFSFADAFFETASALTTTGSSIFGSFDNITYSLMFWRCFSQWIGGLGVVVLFVAVLSFLGAGAKMLYTQESSVQTSQLNTSRVQTGIWHLIICYLMISIACSLTYYFCGMNIYDSLCHMFTTVATGGFSTHEESIAYFKNPILEWAVIFYMILGSTSFVFLLSIFKGNIKKSFENTEVKYYYLIIIISTILFSLLAIFLNDVPLENTSSLFRDKLFQIVSIISTTGFCTSDFTSHGQTWLSVDSVVLIMLMLIGGCTSSTAGGVKVIRAVICLKVAKSHLEHSIRPQVFRVFKINNTPIEKEALSNSVSFMILSIVFLTFSFIIFGICEPHISFEENISTVITFVSNTGPALGSFGPVNNFSELNDFSKYLGGMLMLFGRLDLVAILILFMPSLWKKFS